MNDKKNQLQEQDHPLKNTDQAFVRVGEDGQPVMPASDTVAPNPESEEQVASQQPPENKNA